MRNGPEATEPPPGTRGQLRSALAAGRFVVTAEIGPPRDADPEKVKRKAELLTATGWRSSPTCWPPEHYATSCVTTLRTCWTWRAKQWPPTPARSARSP